MVEFMGYLCRLFNDNFFLLKALQKTVVIVLRERERKKKSSSFHNIGQPSKSCLHRKLHFYNRFHSRLQFSLILSQMSAFMLSNQEEFIVFSFAVGFLPFSLQQMASAVPGLFTEREKKIAP